MKELFLHPRVRWRRWEFEQVLVFLLFRDHQAAAEGENHRAAEPLHGVQRWVGLTWGVGGGARCGGAGENSELPPGLELSFYSGVYGTCIGATAQFGAAAKGLIGISGIMVGVGEILGKFPVWGRAGRGEEGSQRVDARAVWSGGGLFGLLCKNNRFRRTSVVFLGMVVHFVAFYLIFLNTPGDAPLVYSTATRQEPYLTPR